ncbi:MAG: hypothetical protein AAGI53_12815 [Planctomycetota bacterium]
MGHHLCAIATTRPVADEVCARVPQAFVMPLEHGVVMVPVIGAVSEALGDQHPLEGPAMGALHRFFESRPDHQLEALCAEVSSTGDVALISTDYFGGVGEQLAAVWSGGRVVFAERSAGDGPVRWKRSRGPINRALRILGVKRSWGRDEFDAVGLGEHRDLEDFDPEYS